MFRDEPKQYKSWIQYRNSSRLKFSFEKIGENPFLTNIKLYNNDAAFSIELHFKLSEENQDLASRLEKSLQKIEFDSQESEKLKINKGSSYMEIYLRLISKTNSRNAGKLIEVLRGFCDLSEIADDLFYTFNIKYVPISFETLKNMVDNGLEQVALNEASKREYDLYALAKYFDNVGKFDLAYETYKKISEHGHSDCSDANLQITHLISKKRAAQALLVDAKSSDSLEKEDENLTLLEIDALLKCPKDEQRRIDQRIHELAGYYDLKPIIKNVRFNAETMLAFCEHIKSLNEQIASLKLPPTENKNSDQCAVSLAPPKESDYKPLLFSSKKRKRSENYIDEPKILKR